MYKNKGKIIGAFLTSLTLITAVITQIFMPSSIDITVLADELTAETFKDGSVFMIKNAETEMYIDVTKGLAENNVNLQQWGAEDSRAYNTFKLYSAGDGYYNIVSCVGDGGSFAVDVAARGTADGTNICLYTYNGNNNQQFMFLKNEDGSYKIVTKVTNGKSAIEVADGSAEPGANIQQMTLSGENYQNWILEPVTDPGCVMNTSYIYTFKNVNSGLVMDILNGEMAENTNVRQWTSNDLDCQKWNLVRLGGYNDYYILSCQDQGYGLYADWTNKTEENYNIYLKPFDTVGTSNSGMLFRFSKNPDGSYRIIPRSSQYKRYVEVADASNSEGANIQHFTPNDSNGQKWNAITQVSTAATTTTTTTTTITTESETTTSSNTTTTTSTTSSTTTTTTTSTTSTTTTTTTATTSTTQAASSSTTTSTTKAISSSTTTSTTKAISSSTTTSTTKAISSLTTTSTTKASSFTTDLAAASSTKASTTTTAASTTNVTTAPTESETASTTTTQSVTEPINNILIGDVDLNGMVELADVTKLGKYLLNTNIYPLGEDEATIKRSEIQSDVNFDGKIDVVDLSKLIEYNLGKIPDMQ